MFELFKLYLLPFLSRNEEGQDLAEYGVLLGVIAVIVAAGAIILGQNLSSYFSYLSGEIIRWLGS